MHTILSQSIHAELIGSEADGVALQRNLPHICRHGLTPAIEEVLDRHAPITGLLCIERLEIDAGVFSIERLEHDLPSAVAKALAALLLERISPESPAPGISANAIRLKSEGESAHEALCHFLRTGNLPWSFHLPAGSTLEQVVLASWRFPEQAGPGLNRISEDLLLLLNSAMVRKRVVRQFSDEFIRSVLQLVSPSDARFLDEVLSRLTSASLASDARMRLGRALREAILTGIAFAGPRIESDLVNRSYHALAEIFSGQEALAIKAAQLLTGVTIEEHGSSGWKDGMAPAEPHLMRGRRSYPDGSVARHPAKPEPSQSFASSPETPTSDTYSEPPEQGAGERHFLSPETGEGIFIENAGLVLLHPFLPRFFEALAVASEDRLLKPERTLCLLHYLATGQQIAPEYELFLPKILCNLSPETPVEADVGLTGVERDEAVGLLEAVIRHWGALGSCSPDALRGTFLLRKGKIAQRGKDWLLKVESQTCDILLQQLPWGISVIRLPWMLQSLWVEWE
jgi:hypothetical protein